MRFLPAFLLLPVMTGILAAQPREIDLRGICAFRPGDDETWRSKYIDEREGWSFITAPGAWERNGYPTLDGFAWYRFRFQIPSALRGDSLILLIDGIDDADETFLNGWSVGKTGGFPPEAKSECRTLRIYPLPRRMREEYNLIAIRVYDIADSGGITGRAIKIVRAEDRESAIAAIPPEPHHAPPLALSSGACMALFDPETNAVIHFSPHLYREIEPGLYTENCAARISLACEWEGRAVSLDTLKALATEYYQGTAVLRQSFAGGIETFWYLPRAEDRKILVILLQSPVDAKLEDIRLSLSLLRPAFAFREFDRRVAGARRHYFVLSYNSCCREFAERDLEEFLARDRAGMYEAYELEREMMYWGGVRASMRIPFKLTGREKALFIQSVATIISAQSTDPGSGAGQIVSAFRPDARRYAVPFEHLYSAASLSIAGMDAQADAALAFCFRQRPSAYVFYDLYGAEYGLGIPYLIPPAKYLGSGSEFVPTKKGEVPLTVAGNGALFHAYNAALLRKKRESAAQGRIVTDSLLVAGDWPILSRFVADVLMERLDSTGLITRDCGPWGASPTGDHSISASIWAAYGLRIAARYALALRDTIRMVSYSLAAENILRSIRALVSSIAHKSSETELAPLEKLAFDPLLVEAVALGLFPPQGQTAADIVDIVERAYRNGGRSGSFLAKPDGDWFERRQRPYLTMLMTQAYARMGRSDKAEEYFRDCLDIAAEGYDTFPELRDAATRNWYGGVPSVPWGAAAFIQTAQAMQEMRLAKQQ